MAMRLGFYTDYSGDIAKFAQDTGFTSMELSAWPQSSLNADEVTDERLKEIRADLDNRGIEISALGYYPNYLAADEAEATEYKRYFRKVMQLAARMEVPAVCTFAGMTPGLSVEDCMEPFTTLYTEFTKEAEDLGIKIGIENCPMLHHKNRTGENLAFSPEIWQAMFEAVPSPALGLEIDPSHLVFLGIDYLQAIYDFGDRIVHFHAKDIDIDERKRGRLGFYGNAFGPMQGFGNGWWRFRAPGWGVIDWRRVITALTDVGYTGNLDIEHEDEVFAKAAMSKIDSEADIVEMLGKEPNALVLGYRYLAPMMPLDSSELLPH
ncbi:MAG: sugar phosphate isomerase/epimerase [Mycobacterium kyogaense]|uniref:sugar phosphate isomerase/epimerase family protein n=1 Tax=Mycobacterium kyogaense TaxID=2212479 RepID=UPI002FFD2C9B